MLKLTTVVESAEPQPATLTLSFEQRQRSRLRVSLDDGRPAALMLPRGTVLRDGHCLRADDGSLVRIAAAEEEVSTVQCPDPHRLARACYHLGNRHVALQIGSGWLRYLRDHVLDGLVRELGLHPESGLAPFEPEAGAYAHGHGGRTDHAGGDIAEEEDSVISASSHDNTFNAAVDVPPDPSLLSLLRLTSSSLPIGSFAYSQGMEYAVEHGWIVDAASAGDWIAGLLRHVQRCQDMPLFVRLYRAWEAGDDAGVALWNARVLAARESRELRAEEINTGAALARLLADLGIGRARRPGISECISPAGYLGMFALACVEWGIPLRAAICGFLWSWCQNQVAAAIKLVPLGQTAGQRLLQELIALIPDVVEQALAVEDEDMGFTAPGLALASARHEGQYTRLFLS